ncbi:4-hydroxy-tetrahydrodipicolinate synthase [Aquincola tertiaricarbonis]|uniref:4-hydroxy-tetrahydrodipicolinate synthase n=1 Tax=Aquincola tertiaricarbonis TaxID=391953 RepID=UPI000B0DF72F|nr:4-hydroxy-tetrahydrodipicolinate synthase [Aquincola tertiaricarbonis]
MLDLSGVWIPLVTPFDGGRVDLPALRRLVATLATGGIAGYVVCGSTGEAALLSEAEQRQVLQAVMAERAGLPVLMGVAGSAPAAVRDELLQWAECGVQGFLVPPPLYVKPPQAGVIDFFSMLADASPLPVVLYDIPSRTGTRIQRETALALAAHERITGLKDCGGCAADTQALIDDGRLQVLAGDDVNIFATLCAGGAGSISASAHLHPRLFVRLREQLLAGDLPAARRLWQALLPWIDAAFAEPNPAPAKAALAAQGLLKNELRAPMRPVSAALQQRIEGLVADLGRLAAAG